MALSTVSDVKTVIGVDMSSTDETAITDMFIPAVDAAIKNYVGYELEYQSAQVDTLDGKGENEIYTSIAPIKTIASLTEDGTSLTEGNEEQYVAYKAQGRIRKNNQNNWSNIRLQNIVITYSGGYSDSVSGVEDIPKDIKLVSARAAGRMWVASASLGAQQSTGQVGSHTADTTNDGQFQLVESEKIGDYSANYASVLEQMDQDLLHASDMKILNRYKRQFFTSASILD